jgi:16S rRNA (cytosine967-C5)-methyltransferase
LHAVVRVGDALDPTLLQGEFFDRILLDAPCSGTGVIRRHPDIKWLRRPTDLGALAARQSALLSALWPRLAPGGRLVYATCSVLKAENREVIQAFLRERSDAVDVSESASLALDRVVGVSRAAGPGLALLPGPSGMDGFYYACLERRDRP